MLESQTCDKITLTNFMIKERQSIFMDLENKLRKAVLRDGKKVVIEENSELRLSTALGEAEVEGSQAGAQSGQVSGLELVSK